jgi:hypothetical protein
MTDTNQEITEVATRMDQIEVFDVTGDNQHPGSDAAEVNEGLQTERARRGHEMQAREIHAHKMQAHEIHAHRYTPMRCAMRGNFNFVPKLPYVSP